MRTWLKQIQEKNWYKPEPGEPYRPLIAIPSRVKEIQPWLSYCTEVFFTAYDPPTVLRAASALAPPVPSSDPEAHPKIPIPVPSPTVDPVARQTVGSKPSIPLPASTPTMDQPKATSNAAQIAPNDKAYVSSHRPEHDPTSQGSPLLLPTHNAVRPNSDPKGNNDNQRNGAFQPSRDSDSAIESDPDQAIDSKKSNDSGGNLEDGADPKLHSSPNQADSSHRSEQIADPVSRGSDTKHTNEENPFDDLTEGQTTTINDQMIQPLSQGISIAGTTLTPGAPAITVSSTPIHFGASALVVGTSTVPLFPKNPDPDPLTTTIAGHVITVAPDAIAVAGTTLTPGAPPITVSGTPIHFASSALLIIGTSTLPLALAAPTQIVTNIAGQLITAAPSALTIPGTTLSPGSPGFKLAGTPIALDTARHQLFVGTKTIALDFASRKNPIVTEIGGRVISAFPDRIVIASTTLRPGAPALTINGTLVSLDTAAQFVVGSNTISLDEGAGAAGEETAGLGRLIGGVVSGSTGPFITRLPNPTLSMKIGNGSTAGGDNDGDGKGNGNSTSTAVQVFQGSATALLEGWTKMTVSLVMAMAVPVCIC